MAIRINSRTKGNKAERQASKLLETWTGKKFARTPSSGGLNWKSTNVKGDVVCTTEGHYFPFCVEVKSYKEINVSNLIVGKKSCIIYKFWEQSQRESKDASKIPILMMRYNMMPSNEWMVCIELGLYHKLKKYFLKTEHNYLVSVKDNLVLFNSATLLELPYKEIKKLLKRKK